jgi:hypothetical protein
MIAMFAICALLVQSRAAQTIQDVQQSHISANVPAPADFGRLLKADLQAFFGKSFKGADRVEYSMLRDGPTQSGVSYPKYYVWVKVFEGTKLLTEGAVRAAAIERKNFEITDFITASQIRAEPTAIYRVFPAPVCERILSQLGIRT